MQLMVQCESCPDWIHQVSEFCLEVNNPFGTSFLVCGSFRFPFPVCRRPIVKSARSVPSGKELPFATLLFRSR